MSSFSLTQIIPFKTSLSSSVSWFVLKFDLHDSSLNSFLGTAIFSSSFPTHSSCCSSLCVPAEESVCSSLSWCLIFSFANIMQRLSWSSPLFSESSSHSSDSPDNFSSSLYLSDFDHSPDPLVLGVRLPSLKSFSSYEA